MQHSLLIEQIQHVHVEFNTLRFTLERLEDLSKRKVRLREPRQTAQIATAIHDHLGVLDGRDGRDWGATLQGKEGANLWQVLRQLVRAVELELVRTVGI